MVEHTTITLGVFRRLDNRVEGLPDDSPRALELHNRRKAALHEILDNEPGVRVLDGWKYADDAAPHEYVELVIAVLSGPIVTNVVMPGLTWLAQKVAEKVGDAVAGKMATALLARIYGKQKEKQLQDVTIRFGDGTSIRLDPPDMGAAITIYVKGGESIRLDYQQAAQTG